MMEFLIGDYALLALAALFAGLVDAVVGGGGLIQLPALFSVLPQTVPASLFGTNKFSAIWGTLFAARTYARKISVEWGTAIPASGAALLFSFAGAWLVTAFPPDLIRKTLPFLLLAVAIYVAIRKDFGASHVPRFSGARETRMALVTGAGIGFYDGFFGPGTGSFLLFLFVRFFGFDFLGASAVAKIVNVACNFAALIWFGYAGHVLWQLGLLMAICNICGAMIGTRVALKEGSVFIRKAFLVVVGALILKTARDAFWS
ncbi:MAG: hypothetical protein RL717_2421 [Pseudomonadota bacterium]